MARIKIMDLPKDWKISKEELKVIYGGPTRRIEDYFVNQLPSLESQILKNSDDDFIIDIPT